MPPKIRGGGEDLYKPILDVEDEDDSKINLKAERPLYIQKFFGSYDDQNTRFNDLFEKNTKVIKAIDDNKEIPNHAALVFFEKNLNRKNGIQQLLICSIVFSVIIIVPLAYMLYTTVTKEANTKEERKEKNYKMIALIAITVFLVISFVLLGAGFGEAHSLFSELFPSSYWGLVATLNKGMRTKLNNATGELTSDTVEGVKILGRAAGKAASMALGN